MPMGEKHKRILNCPYCKENLKQVWINTGWGNDKINDFVVCPKCKKIFRVQLIELKEAIK